MLELVMYSRSTGCPFVTLAKRVLDEYGVAYREIYIDQDAEAKRRVTEWTGFLSVPTLVVAEPGDDLPVSEPSFLERGRSPRGLDRGSMITEPGAEELSRWLLKHGFIAELAHD
ncbi:MAG: glutaredoxin family protein [Anaerolineae bacterium]|nr:glutaredoxin family protein [Anaerolineae bacterium]